MLNLLGNFALHMNDDGLSLIPSLIYDSPSEPEKNPTEGQDGRSCNNGSCRYISCGLSHFCGLSVACGHEIY